MTPEELQAQFFAQNSGAQVSDADSLPVWIGPTSPPENPRQADLADPGRIDVFVEDGSRRLRKSGYPLGDKSVSTGAARPVESTVGEQIGSFYSFSEEEVRKLRDLASRAGYDLDYMSLRRFWEDVVQLASESYNVGGRRVTPWQAAEMLAADGDALLEERGPTTDTATNYDFTNPDTAAEMVQSLFERQLGRRATPEDISGFVSALRSYEEGSPSVSTRTTTPGADGDQTVTRTEAGADPGAFLSQRFDQEYGDEAQVRMVATEYGDIVDRLIGSGSI